MSERFYINWPLQPGAVVLEGPEAHHLGVVCRLRPGAAVCLFNGDGHEYPAHVVEVGKRQITLEIQARETPQRELGFTLEVAAPLPKGDRGQFLVEKLTELGVTTFVPLSCQRSVVHPREGKVDKMHRYVIEASKQCCRNILMNIEPLADWDTCCRMEKRECLRLVAHPGKGRGWNNLDLPWDRTRSVQLAVGPEGGFTHEEINQAELAGWLVVDLGPRILRIETAALAMTVGVINHFERE